MKYISTYVVSVLWVMCVSGIFFPEFRNAILLINISTYLQYNSIKIYIYIYIEINSILTSDISLGNKYVNSSSCTLQKLMFILLSIFAV